MIAAREPIQRPEHARLLVIDEAGGISHAPRSALASLLRPGDLVVANDASVLPASLAGVHAPSGRVIEVRLAGRDSLDRVDRFTAVAFGEGDHHTLTEDRAAPPPLAPGDRLSLGPLSAMVKVVLGHPRLIDIQFDGGPDAFWAGLALHGRAVQYAHVPEPLQLWDVWSPIAGPPVAFEPPSAGFALDWRMLGDLRAAGARFATLTHAAGLSSTGDPVLDARLPLDEPYRIPPATAAAIRRTRAVGGRVIAIGTTVVRALEHARGRAGDGLADQRLGPDTPLEVVDAILSGTHEPGTSHYELLRAFTDDSVLKAATEALEAEAYLTHEFGDSVLVERKRVRERVARIDSGLMMTLGA